MAQEMEILRTYHRGGELEKPDSVIYWIWWKKYYLEDRSKRELLLNSAPRINNYESFRKELLCITPPKFFPGNICKSHQRISEFINDLFHYYNYTISPELPYKI